MRKILIILLSVFMCLSSALFVACNHENDNTNPDGQTELNPDENQGDGNNEDAQKDDEGDDVEEKLPELNIIAPDSDSTTEPYAANVKKYLNAQGNVNVADYLDGISGGYQGVEIAWITENVDDAVKYTLEYSRNADYSDAETLEVSGKSVSATLDNLYKDAVYYVRLTLVREQGENIVRELSFRTTDIGPRPLTIDGIRNVRDLGGYRTEQDEVTLQGMIYRGGSLSSTKDYPTYSLTEDGKKYMSEVLNIRFDMDLRGNSEGGVNESPIPNAKIEWFGIDGYASAFSKAYRQNYYNVFKTFSIKENYPIYMHCTGGADRTGTVAFLLNALLGVSKRDLIHDYEYTSFSPYLERNSKTGIYSKYFIPFLEQFEAIKGVNYSQKAENYLLGLGLSEVDIYNIRAIMTGKPVKVSVSADAQFNGKSDEAFFIGISDTSVPETVIINGSEVAFESVEGGVRILNAAMPNNLTDGTVSGKCVINGMEYPFSFRYSSVLVTAGFDFSGGDITVDTQHNLLEGETIGYNGDMWQFKVGKHTHDGNGKTHFMVGSYGVIHRGGCFRMAVREQNGTFRELSPRVQYNYSVIDNKTLGFTFTEENDHVTMNLYIEGELCYTYDFAKIANEIASENAKCTVFLGPETYSVVLKEK